MPPLASTIFNIDTWKNDPPDLVELKCFLPNGIIILLTMPSTATIREIKMETIKKSRMFPLNHLIKDACDYVVSGIIQFGDIEHFTDETKRLCDVQPYFCLLVLGERKETKNEKVESDYELLKLVTNTIGKSVSEYKLQTTQLEVVDFRRKGMEICEKIELERSQYTWLQKLFYEHPIRLANTPIMPQTIRDRLHSPNFLVVIILENDGTTFTLSVTENDTPRSLMESVLQKMNRSQIKMTDRLSDYILKVRGCDEYIYGDHPLIQFLYIQESVSGNEVPYLVLKSIQSLQCYINHKTEQSLGIKPAINRDSTKYNVPTIQKPRTSLWRMKEYFSLRLQRIENVNCDLARAIKVGVHIGLYHGEQKLCAQLSVDAPNKSSRNFIFDTVLEFDIKMLNLPRMTRLCIVIYEVTKLSRSKKSSNTSKDNIYKDSNIYNNINPLAWVNTTLFDYKSQLRTGLLSLYSWTYADDIQTDEIFHPLGTIEPNPRKDECAVVHLTFLTNDADNIFYPSEEAVLHYAVKASRDEVFIREQSIEQTPLMEVLNNCMGIDKIGEIYDQDRSAIWQYRYDIRQHHPEKLSAVLHCVNWNERDKVAEMWSLLNTWPTISIERSLELLDYAFPDPAVRKFAIQCLRLLRDEELLLYLLQLVQAIKHESYLDCDLVIFLLERSLRNQRIGHYFFWHLRSETQTLSMQTRFSLLLEVYLKGSKQHVLPLQKQLIVLEKLKQCSTDSKKGGKDKVKNLLQDFLKKKENISVFQNIQNPLNPSYRWRCVRPEQCKVMDSKMRPLWIVFENADSNHNDIYVIFKNGDDLRQDMLTLQMLRVMDQLWKNEGMDFRMNIYNCISMERRLGMIEVVRHAETIANIQKEKGMFSATSPFKKGSIFTWLKEHNKSEDSFNKAIKEFTLSCAGYCVATYVLGVADRHSDNIMVKRNGQLFHIDFGHILGHFKEKFGVKRERVPFVLTHDFVYVINKGCTDREAEEFRYFQSMCEQAFLVLRKHGCLILSLFSMMISTGLPELSSEKDLNYLKETLVLDYTEEKALAHFQAKFSEALANSWKTSLNWASHNFSKNNKQ